MCKTYYTQTNCRCVQSNVDNWWKIGKLANLAILLRMFGDIFLISATRASFSAIFQICFYDVRHAVSIAICRYLGSKPDSLSRGGCNRLVLFRWYKCISLQKESVFVKWASVFLETGHAVFDGASVLFNQNKNVSLSLCEHLEGYVWVIPHSLEIFGWVVQ